MPYYMDGLLIDCNRLCEVIEHVTEEVERPKRVVQGGDARDNTFVSEAVLVATREKFPKCKCEDLGLRSGMSIRETGKVNCCDGMWICPRIDRIRRKYGF